MKATQKYPQAHDVWDEWIIPFPQTTIGQISPGTVQKDTSIRELSIVEDPRESPNESLVVYIAGKQAFAAPIRMLTAHGGALRIPLLIAKMDTIEIRVLRDGNPVHDVKHTLLVKMLQLEECKG